MHSKNTHINLFKCAQRKRCKFGQFKLKSSKFADFFCNLLVYFKDHTVVVKIRITMEEDKELAEEYLLETIKLLEDYSEKMIELQGQLK